MYLKPWDPQFLSYTSPTLLQAGAAGGPAKNTIETEYALCTMQYKL